jgi:hypothetical protein
MSFYTTPGAGPGEKNSPKKAVSGYNWQKKGYIKKWWGYTRIMTQKKSVTGETCCLIQPGVKIAIFQGAESDKDLTRAKRRISK